MLNGENDNIVPRKNVEYSKTEIEACGANVTQRFLPGHGHEYPTEETKNIAKWFLSFENSSS